MSDSPLKRILARHRTSEFVDRQTHVERLLSLAQSVSHPNGIALLSAPSAGASELLRHTFDRLFTEQETIVPFYFELKPADNTAQAASLRFLCEFLIQTVAFRRREPTIIGASPAMAEIADLAAPADGHWIGRLVDTYRADAATSERSFIRNCLGAPVRAAANGSPVFVMIDGAELARYIEDGDSWLDDAVEMLSTSSVPFVISGLRRALFARTMLDTLSLEPFSFRQAADLIERLADDMHVRINDQTRDLIAVQLSGNAGYITSLMSAAAASGRDLMNFEQVEQVYTDEIFGGRIARGLDSIYSRISPDADKQRRVISLLSELAAASDALMTIQQFTDACDGMDAALVLRTLNDHEIISLGAGQVAIEGTNMVVRDHIDARARSEVIGEQRALAVGRALTANVKRAPSLMASHYRRASAIGVKELLSAFDGRGIAPGLIDYSTYKDELKGKSDNEILETVMTDQEVITLPRIVYAADTTAFYPPLRELIEAERSAVALGFTGPGEENEVVWIGAEIDSKLEASADVAQFWCDRLEMVALNCDFRAFRLWLIAPEGFDAAAIRVLDDRNAFGSSRRQADLLRRVLLSEADATSRPVTEYEFTLPMGDDTELIAAHAVEEIARRHSFSPKAINQIKTAVVEACINAVEHSLSPDRKIYQRFAVDNEKLTVTIANRGLRLTDRQQPAPTAENGRRGWGLQLMKGLMDELKIEQTDDGTRITMVKYLKAPAGVNPIPSK